jgi:glycosyltransferase involved in cell wall biosynthesis
MNDLVSVVVPVFNRRGLIGRALESVQAQTYTSWEIVVVDDGSTDGTAEMVESLRRDNTGIGLLRHAHRMGAQAARNTGIRAAKGRWVAFLDSDDWLLPDSLERRVRLACEGGVHIVHSDCLIIEPGQDQPRRYGVPVMHGRVYHNLLERPGPLFPCLMISAEALTRIGNLDQRIVSFQEWDTAIMLAKHYEFGYVPEPTFVYDCRTRDTMSKDLDRTAEGYRQVVAKHWLAILRSCGPMVLARHYETAAIRFQQANRPADARRCSRVATLLWPIRLGGVVVKTLSSAGRLRR